MVGASGFSSKSHLWDQFLRDKAESSSNNDLQFPLVHAFSLSPMISIGTIIALARTRTEDHEDTLVAMQSDLPFFIERLQYHRNLQERNRALEQTDLYRKSDTSEVGCAEFSALQSEYASRLSWHVLLELLERLNDVLGCNFRAVSLGEREIAIQEVNGAIEVLLNRYLLIAKSFILSFMFGHERISKVAMSVLVKTKPAKRHSQSQDLNLKQPDPFQCPLAITFRSSFTDAELREEDWLLWCIDHVLLNGVRSRMLLRRLLQYLQKHPDVAKELPDELLIWIEEISVLWKACDYLHYCVPGADGITTPKSGKDTSELFGLCFNYRTVCIPEVALIGGEMERKASGLKVVRPSPRRDKNWLVRSDASYSQLADVHRIAVDAFIDTLINTEHKMKSLQPALIRNLLLRQESDGKTPISNSERARLTGSDRATPALLAETLSSSLSDSRHIPLPQQPEDKFKIPKQDKKNRSALPNLGRLSLHAATTNSLDARGPTQGSKDRLHPLDLPLRAYHIAEQLFSSAPR
jgi:hypothetical protein